MRRALAIKVALTELSLHQSMSIVSKCSISFEYRVKICLYWSMTYTLYRSHIHKPLHADWFCPRLFFWQNVTVSSHRAVNFWLRRQQVFFFFSSRQNFNRKSCHSFFFVFRHKLLSLYIQIHNSCSLFTIYSLKTRLLENRQKSLPLWSNHSTSRSCLLSIQKRQL